jgi:uncharacterized protein (TIGR02246 family)
VTIFASEPLAVFRRLATVCLLLALSACAGKTDAPSVSQDTRQADEAAVRTLLANIQSSFNAGNLDDFMPVFADDAVLMAQGLPNVVGAPAIRAVYEGALSQMDIKTVFNTEEIQVFGDLAYERGTYILKLSEKGSGKSLGEVNNRHVHVFRKQSDGRWKTWRMMTNSAEAAPAPPAAAQ